VSTPFDFITYIQFVVLRSTADFSHMINGGPVKDLIKMEIEYSQIRKICKGRDAGDLIHIKTEICQIRKIREGRNIGDLMKG